MKKNKGFTLVELLAVISILSFIALITTPIILKLVEDARKKSFMDSAYGVVQAGEFYYAKKQTKGEDILDEITFSFPDATDLELKGTKPKSGNMKILKSGKIELAISDGKFCATKGMNDIDIRITKDVENCLIPISIEDISFVEKEVSLKVKDTKKLNVTISPTNATNKKINWKSNNEKIATVDNNGNVTGISEGITTITITADGTNISKNITITVETNLYKDETLNGTTPEIKNGIIPVTIENNGVVKKADLSEPWYDYNNNKWANAVLVTNSSRAKYANADSKTEINQDDILIYLVWIPRYKYKLWYVEAKDSLESNDSSKVHSINIVFENKKTAKSKGSSNGEYLTHPAFTFGTQELDGFWVGKFESGYKSATSSDTAFISKADINNLVSKPNMYTWRSLNISSAFQMIQKMTNDNNPYGLSSNTNSHMMKNTEWGAVAYLSHSKYGKNSEVYPNNYAQYKTSCGADYTSEKYSYTCKNSYGTRTDGKYNQTTTGNITGIFDMSAGAEEAVMGYTTGAKTKYGSSGFTDSSFPEKKYIDLYSTTVYSQYSKRILGDATGEMGPFYPNSGVFSSWYTDNGYLPDQSSPWLLRGGKGYRDNNSYSGIFSFEIFNGAAGNYAFRITLN